MSVLDELKPGDALLYGPRGVYGLLIAIKTWHAVAHCEAYIGIDGRPPIRHASVASRDGIGVGVYPTRVEDLRYVMRPVLPFDFAKAMTRFRSEWQGQGYDWLGLIRFAWREPVSNLRFNNKQFCSELLARWYRAGGIDAFNGEDPDAVAPSEFLQSLAFRKLDVRNGALVVPEVTGV